MMRFLDQDFLQAKLGMPQVIDSLTQMLAYKAQHPEHIQNPERMVLPIATGDNAQPTIGSYLCMPATVRLADGEYTSTKLVTICPDNPKHGLPTTNASIVLTENRYGQTLAMMDAGFITQIRTGALSGIATDRLAKPDAASVAVVGCGGMAYEQLNAVLSVRPSIKTVYLSSRNLDNAHIFAKKMQERYPAFSVGYEVCDSVEAAVANADIINLATRAEQGLFKLSDIKSGTHINAVGAYLPHMKEVGNDVIAACRYVVIDDQEGCHAEAGDLIQADQDPSCDWRWQDVTCDLPKLVTKPLARAADDITLFKSVGAAYFDAAVAVLAYQLASQA